MYFTGISALSVLFQGEAHVEGVMPQPRFQALIYSMPDLLFALMYVVSILGKSFEFTKSHNGRFQMTLVINTMARSRARIGTYCSYFFLSLSPAPGKQKILASDCVTANNDNINYFFLNEATLFKKQNKPQKEERDKGRKSQTTFEKLLTDRLSCPDWRIVDGSQSFQNGLH